MTSVFVSPGYAVVCPSELRKMQTYPRRSLDGIVAELQKNYWWKIDGQWVCSYYSPNIYPPECESGKALTRGKIQPVYVALSEGNIIDVYFADDRAAAVAHFQRHGYVIEE